MRFFHFALFIVLLSAASRCVRAEEKQPAAEYIEYRSLPDLGTITISNGLVRGRKAVAFLTSHATQLSRVGIFSCTDDHQQHTYARKESMGGHTIQTLIAIEPPAEEGQEDTRSQHLVVLVDGARKIDCTIGTSADGNLLVYGFSIFPEDGSIEVVAVSGDGREMTLPADCRSLDKPDVITDDAFDEDRQQDEDVPEREPAMRV